MFAFDSKNNTKVLGSDNLISDTNSGCSHIATILRFELSPLSDILVNLTVWDTNLKGFCGKLLTPQGFGASAV